MTQSIFEKEVTDQFIARINRLTHESPAKWGKMNVAQMLAHCCVTYEMLDGTAHPKPSAFVKLMLKLFVKGTVIGDKPYKKNGRTAPAFLIVNERSFETEKSRLISYLLKTQQMGAHAFDGKESHSFGKLTVNEWNKMFSKHLDHHLSQFGV